MRKVSQRKYYQRFINLLLPEKTRTWRPLRLTLRDFAVYVLFGVDSTLDVRLQDETVWFTKSEWQSCFKRPLKI
jgi:hypothetical protein